METENICIEDGRRDAVRARPELNGLDYVEVGDDQLTLTAYFLGKAPEQLRKGAMQYVRIEGGERISGIKVVDLDVTRDPDPEVDDYATVRVDRAGDFSTYTLRLIGLENIDPFYDHAEFSFKVNCPGDMDCAPADTCPPQQWVEPAINYLAKDFSSFRQLILDRLALIMPDWQERHAPDLGVALVEILAYVGDYLSYHQDAVATEAYLDTARRRISVRRHARLVDYLLHEGCNARAWLAITTDTDLTSEHALDPKEVYFITTPPAMAAIDGSILSADQLRNIPPSSYEPFEAITDQPIEIYAFRSTILFYTWGQQECCLPRGATSATLVDAWETESTGEAVAAANPARKLRLNPGDALIFEEVLGPLTGQAADADPTHRHCVRLTAVIPGVDPLNGQPVVEIEWSNEDALPFALCLSAVTDAGHGCEYHENVSVVRGNVILVDHGTTIKPCEELGAAPTATGEADCDCPGHPSDVRYTAGRFRPRLANVPLTHRQPLPSCTGRIAPASCLMTQDPRRALPQASLNGILALSDAGYRPVPWAELSHYTELMTGLNGAGFTGESLPQGVPLSPSLFADYRESLSARDELAKAMQQNPGNQKLKDDLANTTAIAAGLLSALINELLSRWFCWEPQGDLLGSAPDDRHFVAEIDNEGVAWLRFGDGESGRTPEAASTFNACYRVGNGTVGNVGAESISRLVFRHEKVSIDGLTVRNPLPARGGMEREPIAEAKLFAPTAFRDVPMRAITADDYATLAEREFGSRLQRAAAVLSWSGSWYEADLAVDPMGSEIAQPALMERIERVLQRYRRMGHDLEVEPARYVPIELELTVCVLPHFLRGHVKAALAETFSNRALPGGRLGFFHPDNLSFGEGLYLGRIVAAAQSVTGVESVRVTKLNRLFESPNRELENGVLPLGPLEVAQLDNDPSFPERGLMKLVMLGGR